ncbi:hypothetical protein HZS_3798 [Henneguya salminicola]|nr:hypothetical protein HZS_3798 [Henneguya salminicola]
MSNTNCTKESIREISSKEGYYSYPYRNNALSLYSIGCCFPTDQQEDQFQQIQESQYKSLNIEQYHPHNFYCKKNEKLSISRKYHMPIYRENIERLFNVANLQLPQYKVEKIHYYRCNFEIDPRTPFPSPVSVQSVEEQLHEQEANAEEDADRLFIAFSGMGYMINIILGCDIKTICGILTHRNRVQREEIRIAYESKRAEILSKRVISEVLEPLRTLILYLLYTGPDLDAIILNMSRTKSKEDFNLIDEELELEKLKNVCPSVTYNISCHCL